MKRYLAMTLALLLLIGTLPIHAIAQASTSNQIDETVQQKIDEINNSIGTLINKSFVVPVVSQTSVPDGYTGIYSKSDLNNVRNNLAGSYILMNDIEFTDEDFAEGGAFYNNGAGWTPIGENNSEAFTGTFDGNGFVIKNLYVNIDSENADVFAGLFGHVKNAIIQNLGIEDGRIAAMVTTSINTYVYAGGIAGYVYGSEIINCYHTGSVSASASVSIDQYYIYVMSGGIAGQIKSNSIITNCYNTGSVTASSSGPSDFYRLAAYSGGVVGDMQKSTVTRCFNTGTVATNVSDEVYAYTGGITGKATDNSSIDNCYNTGIVTSTAYSSSYVGGIAGELANGAITNCYNTGSVEATSSASGVNAGGIAGSVTYVANITNSYNTGSVTGTSKKHAQIGGIAGYVNNNTITGCYNTGIVSGTSTETDAYSGGIAGHVYAYNTDCAITDCFSTGNVIATASGSAFAGGITGYMYGYNAVCKITGSSNTGCVTVSTSGYAYAGGLAGLARDCEVSNCYNTGCVKADSLESRAYAGGIVGNLINGNQDMNSYNCYNIGSVEANAPEDITYVGGIVGQSHFVAITNCYYLDTISVGIGSGSGSSVALSEQQMKQQSSFVGFDFDEVWMFDEEGGYPYPILQGMPSPESEAPETEAPETDAPETQAPETEAPETDAPETQAPETEAPETEAPETEAPETEAPETEAPETQAPETKAPYVEFPSQTTVPEGYIGIYTKEDLNNVRNNLAGSYILMNDIEFTDADFAAGGLFYNNGNGWNPIGANKNEAFTGTFDGNGHAIKNLYVYIIDNSERAVVYVGLFGYVDSATVKNIGLENGCVTATSSFYSYVGSIAGYASNSNLTNCYNTGIVTSSSSGIYAFAGGIAGLVYDGSLTNCYNTGSITATSSSTSTSSCAYAGGIAADVFFAEMTNCYNTGSVTATFSSSSSARAGGIVGEVSNSSIITNCYNTGSVTLTSSKSGGDAGGIAGSAYDCSITNCYYLNTASVGVGYGTDTATALTEEQMKQQNSFVGFDFDQVWTFNDETGYPYPILQRTPSPEYESPETEAPETEAPETEAPETEAPETEAPVAEDVVIELSTNVADIKATYGETAVIKKADGTEVTTGRIGTGYTIHVGNAVYTAIVKGDVNGEGRVDMKDINAILKHLQGVTPLTDVYLTAACTGTSDRPSMRDINAILKIMKGQ